MEIFDHIIYTDEIIGIGPLKTSDEVTGHHAVYFFELFLKNGITRVIGSEPFPAIKSGPCGEKAEEFKGKYEQHKSLIRALDLAKRRSDGGAWNQSNVAAFTEMPT